MINNGRPRGANLGAALQRESPEGSFTWSLVVALGMVTVYMTAVILVGLARNLPADPLGLCLQAALVYPVLLALVFALRLWTQSRIIQERSFAWFGFLATFFGLAMLVIFFWQLSAQTVLWFRIVPVLVERENERLQARLDKAEQVERGILPPEERVKIDKDLADELARLDTEEEKKELREFFEKEVVAKRVNELAELARDWKTEAELGIRPDTSPFAVLGFFLSQGPSNKPQDAGIYPALLGSVWLALITVLFAVPVGVGAALYLEEYRQTSWLGTVIQININNLAGVPSIVYGILGAFVFVELIFKPLDHNQSRILEALAADPGATLAWWEHLLAVLPAIAARNVLGGGLTLGLLTLPVVIVAAQEAIRAVPSSIRQGAYALGATQWQVIWHQVLPVARPGILTGTILALSRAMGEAAALVFFGALLFVNQDPSLFSRFTILPMQIFGWADRPAVTVDGVAVEIWHYNAAIASLVLLLALLTLNGFAIYLRQRSHRQVRW